jgi:hypothetical protein
MRQPSYSTALLSCTISIATAPAVSRLRFKLLGRGQIPPGKRSGNSVRYGQRTEDNAAGR